LAASLRGGNEVPHVDSQATATATFTLNGDAGRVCWTFSAMMNFEGKRLFAHIHSARAGHAGNIVVPLGARFARHGCVLGIKAQVIGAISGHPSAYYVNIHTKKYPNGAARGQLRRA
jgi:hypothetical protein